ncbi:MULTISPECIES: SpaH/EbpB family LPXTG-anchored major pilin [Corynebacterium]|uniref:SpaH/EbpB family LPXTG-anchored major pilin n=1 Tax=Corynebacterium TaxID=1716 RepID=UPI00257B19C6|nr:MULTISPECIES: SpaH/EbpB family LPXTG-anchored major pilin [Corynebacterium]
MVKKTNRIRAIGAATVFGVALSTASIGIAPAFAQDGPAVVSNPGNIDFSKSGSITVHKRDLGADATAPATGNVNDNAPGQPLAGAGFTLYNVTNADLKTNAGFAAAAALTPGTALLGGVAGTGVSDAAGLVNFGDLPVGVYLLRETDAPEGYTPSADAIVFVPMTNPEKTDEWNYDVHVYPKNSKNETTKIVEDAGDNAGDAISYTITGDVPKLASDDTVISKYEVTDDLDETRLEAPSAIDVTLSNGTALVAGTDYKVSVDSTTLQVKVAFTSPGLEKLTAAKKADANVKVVTKITATLKKIGDSMDLKNEATTITNNGGGGGDTTTPSNPVHTYHGILRVNKTGDDKKPLAGAQFQVYECVDQSNLGRGPLTVGGMDKWTTSEQGSLFIESLHVTDYENGAEVPATKKYCLVETKAPEGYELLPTPVAVDFTRASVGGTSDVEGDDAITQVAQIENVKSTTPNLPLTGGAGVGLLAAIGAAIVAAGAYIARRLNRA